MSVKNQPSSSDISSTEEAVQRLSAKGYNSVFDIVRQPKVAFCQQLSVLPMEQAQEIYALATQRVDSLNSILRAYRSRNEPVLQSLPKLGVNPSPQALTVALERSLGGSLDFEELFPDRSAEGYTDAASIQSLFSPGRYLTELYKIAKGLHKPSSPLNIDNRRPDIKTLTLSDDNMLKEASTLGILIDILISGMRRANPGATLASLETTYFPMTLPYHDNLVQIRTTLNSKGSSLQQVWDVLLDQQALNFNPLVSFIVDDMNDGIATPSPATREELLLTPTTYQLLVGADASAETIQRNYNLDSEDIHGELKPVTVFTAKTGLNLNQLLQMTGQVDSKGATPEDQQTSRYFQFGLKDAVAVTEFGQSYLSTSGDAATPLLVVSGAGEDEPVELNLDSENAVVLADRAERLIRLQRQLKLEFYQLDWLIKNANLAHSQERAECLLLDTPVLEAIAEFQRLHTAYALSADAFACFIGDMNTYAPQSVSSLYRQVFTSKTDGKTVPLDVLVNFDPEAGDANASLIAGSLGVSVNELFAMAQLTFTYPTTALWNTRSAAQLYRQAIIPQMLGITYYQAVRLWKMLTPDRDMARLLAGAPTLETLALIQQTEAVLLWMTTHQLAIDDGFNLVNDQYTENVTPELFNFVDNIYTTFATDPDVSIPLSEGFRQKMFKLISATFQVKANVMACLIDWLDCTFTTVPRLGAPSQPYGLSDFWVEIDELFNSGAPSIYEELHYYPDIARYSQALGQYALIAQWANLTEQDLNLIVARPSSARRTSFSEGAVSAPDLKLLLFISRLKEWQQRIVVSEAEAMSYFKYANQAGQTAAFATEMLARIHGWDLDTTREMNDMLVRRGTYPAFATTFAHLSQLEASMQVSLQSGLGCALINSLYVMSLDNDVAEDPSLIRTVAEACAAMLSSADGVATGTAPVAKDVIVEGVPTVGEVLTGSYSYVDAEGDLEGETLLCWYRISNDGDKEQLIEGANSSTYTLTVEDEKATLKFSVTPVARSGTPIMGSEHKSAATAIIAPKRGSAPTATGVTIEGIQKVGETLTGRYTYFDADGDLEGETTFLWSRAGGHGGGAQGIIEGAVEQTYTLAVADEGAVLTFLVTPKARTGDPVFGSQAIANTEAISAKDGTAPVASSVAVSGCAQVGETLIGTYLYADAEGDPQGESTFRWMRSVNGATPIAIAGATAATYTLTEEDVGATLQFQVTPIARTGVPNRGAPRNSAATEIAVFGHAPEAKGVNIYGCPQVGETLTGTYWYVDQDNDAEGETLFRWLRAGGHGGGREGVIEGATTQSYTVTAEDEGAVLAFSVTPVALTGKPNIGVEKVAATPPIAAKRGSPPMAQNVSIRGYLQVGETLTGTYDYVDTEGNVENGSTFQWFRNTGTELDGAIEGATEQTYVLQEYDVGATLQFAVIPRALTGLPNVGFERICAPTAIVQFGHPPEAQNVEINGCLQVGEPLTGTYEYVDKDNDLEGETTFQWYRTGTTAGAIAGATQKTYLVTLQDLGATLQFEVAPVARTGTPVIGPKRKSAPSAVVESPSAPSVLEVLVQGNARVGEVLTGHYTYYDENLDQEGQTSLQWYRRDSESGIDELIPGATNEVYTVTEWDLGKRLVLAITPLALTGTPIQGDTRKSAPTDSVVPGHAPQARAVMVEGAPIVGQTLTGSYKYLDHDRNLEGATTMRWRKKFLSKPGRGWEDIEGATDRQLLLTDAHAGHIVAFCVTPISLTGAPDTGTEVCAYSTPIDHV